MANVTVILVDVDNNYFGVSKKVKMTTRIILDYDTVYGFPYV